MNGGSARDVWLAFARVVLTAVLLGLVATWVDGRAVLTRLADLSLGWVALALAVSVLQVGVLAWRWRFTAARLGLDLSWRDAFAEYYLAIFVNQVLPGGVVGDVSRAWRHARTSTHTGPAVRAVVLERASAQLVMVLAAVLSLFFLPGPGATTGPAALAVGGAATLAAVVMLVGRTRWRPALGKLWEDAGRACLARDAVGPQLASASAVVASYVLVFLIAARAVGVAAPFLDVLPMVAPVLMAMLIPVTVAGWGVREAAAAGLWGLAGLSPDEGAAVSVTYGLLVLVSSAPGFLVLIAAVGAGRDRRERPPRA